MAANTQLNFSIKAVNDATAAMRSAEADLRRVADEAENSSRKASAALDKLGEAGGDSERALRGVADIATFMGEQVGVNLGPLQEYGAAFADLGGGIEGALQGGPKMLEFLKGLPASIAPAIAGAWAHVTALYAQAAAFIVANAPIILIVAGLAALAAAVYLVVSNWGSIVSAFTWVKDNVPGVGAVVDGLVTAFQSVVTFLQDTWGGFTDLVSGPLTAAIGWITSNWPLVLAIITGPLGLMVLWIVENWNTISDAVTGPLNTAIGWVTGVWSAITGFLTDPVDTAKKTISDLVDGIVGFFTGLPGRIAELGGNFWTALYGLGSNIADGIVDGIGSIAGKALNLGETILSAIKGGINAALRWLHDNLSFTIGGGSFLGVSIPSYTFGFPSLQLAKGMWDVPGPSGAGDIVPAMLSPGEMVIPAGPAERIRNGDGFGGTQIIQLVVDGEVLAQAVRRADGRAFA